MFDKKLRTNRNNVKLRPKQQIIQLIQTKTIPNNQVKCNASTTTTLT